MNRFCWELICYQKGVKIRRMDDPFTVFPNKINTTCLRGGGLNASISIAPPSHSHPVTTASFILSKGGQDAYECNKGYFRDHSQNEHKEFATKERF